MTAPKLAAITLTLGGLFAWLAEATVHGRTLEIDNYLRLALHAHASPALTTFMRWVSMAGEPVLLLTLTSIGILLFVNGSRRRTLAVFLVSVGGADLAGELLKRVFHRARPEAFFGFALPDSYSFPSGHSVNACALFSVLAMYAAARTQSRMARMLGYAGAALAILTIGFSRIYLGVHYPSDVLGGYLFAALWLSFLVLLRMRYFTPPWRTSGEFPHALRRRHAPR